MKKLDLNTLDVIEFYNLTNSTYKTAKHFNCSPSKIQNVINKNNVLVKKNYIKIDKYELEKLYKIEKRPLKEIADFFNCKVHIIRNNLVSYKIKPNNPKQYKKPKYGTKFNRWKFIEEIKKTNTKLKWKCECECGTVKIIDYYSVKFGISKSCGCYHDDKMKEIKWKGFKYISGSYWSSLQRGAKSRKIKFNLTIQEAWEIFEKQNGICKLTGLKMTFPKKCNGNKGLYSPSIDRINSELGYETNNVQWVVKAANYMKRNLDEKTFIKLCKLIYKNKKND